MISLFITLPHPSLIPLIFSGVITTAKALNRELQSDYNITIQVSDEGNKVGKSYTLLFYI